MEDHLEQLEWHDRLTAAAELSPEDRALALQLGAGDDMLDGPTDLAVPSRAVLATHRLTVRFIQNPADRDAAARGAGWLTEPTA